MSEHTEAGGLVEEYAAGYEYRGDSGGCYTPPDGERAMLIDFGHGLLNIAIASERAAHAETKRERDEARQALGDAASALDEAREDVSHWGSYAGEYFQDKHDLEGDLDRISKQADATRRVREGGSNG